MLKKGKMVTSSNQNRLSLEHRTEMTNEPTQAKFSEKSLKFLKSAGNQNDAGWLEENDADYQQLIRLPLVALATALKDALSVESNGYDLPTKGIGRIKKPSNKVGLNGAQFMDWVSLIASRPSLSRFEKKSALFFGLLPNDPQRNGVVIAGGLYMPSSTQTRRIR